MLEAFAVIAFSVLVGMIVFILKKKDKTPDYHELPSQELHDHMKKIFGEDIAVKRKPRKPRATRLSELQ